MTDTFTDLAESKLMEVLEFYLSLHEADEIYNMIFDENISSTEVWKRLKEIRANSDIEGYEG